MNRTEQILTDMNVKPLFYYDGSITVCLLLKDGKVLSRGISICSQRDNFIKRVGRAKALGRAVQAEINNRTMGLIFPERFPDKYNEDMLYAAKEFKYKTIVNPKLTSFEANLIKRKAIIYTT